MTATLSDRLTAEQLDGMACIRCGHSFTETPIEHMPVGELSRGMVFACINHDAGDRASSYVWAYLAETDSADALEVMDVVHVMHESERHDPAEKAAWIRNAIAERARVGRAERKRHAELQQSLAHVAAPEGVAVDDDWDTLYGFISRPVYLLKASVGRANVDVFALQREDGSITDPQIEVEVGGDYTLSVDEARQLAEVMTEAARVAEGVRSVDTLAGSDTQV